MTGTEMAGLNRRDLIKVSVGGAAALWLGSSVGALAQAETIKAAWYGGQDTHDRMQKAIALFSAKNPDVAVTVEFAPFAEFYDRLPVQYSGGGAPDMHRHSMTYLFDYLKRGLLADLTPYIGSTIDISALYPGVVDIGKNNDEVRAIGSNNIAVALFYNKAKVDAAALDNLTWDSFKALATRIGKDGGANSYGTNDGGGFIGFFELFVTQRGKSLYSPENQLGFDKQDLVDWLAFWEEMRAGQGAPPSAITAESAGFQNAPMVKGTAAMQVGWNQQIVFYQALMQDELDIHPCPVPAGAADNGHLIRASISGHPGKFAARTRRRPDQLRSTTRRRSQPSACRSAARPPTRQRRLARTLTPSGKVSAPTDLRANAPGHAALDQRRRA